jgi:hypothetical protein
VERQSSTYRGVSWNKRDNIWAAYIHYDGKQRSLGYFEDEEEAARAYDKAARAQLGEKAQLNFPTKKEQAAEEAKQQQWIKFREAGSKYRGINWNNNRNKWVAEITCNGKKHSLGSFKDEEEAAKAQLNFPAEGESGSRKSSKYRGVNWKKIRNTWVAEITCNGKRHHLGYFEDEEEAARAYDRAARMHKGEKAQLNFAPKQLRGER